MKQNTRRRLQNIGVLAIILAGFAWIAGRFISFTSSTFTDNAQVWQRIVPVNSRVQGFVKEIRFAKSTPRKEMARLRSGMNVECKVMK